MSSARTPIGEILLRHEHLRPRELERLLAEPDRKQRLISMLILRAEIEVDDATLALSEQTGYPGALERHLEQRDTALAKGFPQPLMRSMGVVPLTRTAAGALVVIARDPSPALADVLRSELATPIELAVVPAIFIDRLVQRLAGASVAAGPPSLPELDRPAPTRHRKSISVIMKAPLESEPVKISPPDDAVAPHDTSLGMPAVRPPAGRATPVIMIPAREDSGARLQPREGSAPNAIPTPRTISSNTIKRQPGGSGPNPAPQPPRTISSNTIKRQPGGSGPNPAPQPPRTISSNTIKRQPGAAAPLPRPPSEGGFETRTPPIGSRGGPPRPPPPEPPTLTLDLDDDEPPPPITTTRPTVPLVDSQPLVEPPLTTTRPTQPLVEPPLTTTRPTQPLVEPPLSTTRPTRPLVDGPPKRPTQPLPEAHRRAGPTHPISNATLQPLLDESEPTPPPIPIDDIAMIESRPPPPDAVSLRPTRPAIIVPAEAIEEAMSSERPTRQNVQPPQRSTPNIIKRPPTPLPIAPQASLVPIDEVPEPPADPARAQIRPTYPKLEMPSHDRPTVVPKNTDDDWNDFEDAIVTAPPQDLGEVSMEDAHEVATRAPTTGPDQEVSFSIGVPLDIVRDIERALSRATADRLLMKHAATRWHALLLVTITSDRARGARGHGPRLQAGVESIEIPIASSSLIQAACDPEAARPDGKDPLFDLLGNPGSPCSVPVVVDGRVIAVLAAGDSINGGSVAELRSLAGALAVAYQRFPVR